MLKKLVCLFVCSKSARKRILDICEDKKRSIFERIKLEKFLLNKDKANKNKVYENFISVLAIIRNEEPYLQEWIEYHRTLGVQKFYIYDNESNDNTKKVLMPYIKSGIVEYTFFPGDKAQLSAYEDCISKHKDDTKWLVVIDIDEFIVHTGNLTLCELLSKTKFNVSQILAEHVFYGSDGHIEKPNGLVIENYLKRCNLKKRFQTKAIVNPRRVCCVGVHDFSVAGKTVYMKKSILRCNHYFCKSWKEFCKRASRGDAFYGKEFAKKTFDKKRFDECDFNDVYDPIMLQYADIVKSRINKLSV